MTIRTASRNARRGEGVYFTRLSPYESKDRLALNNYDTNHQCKEAKIIAGYVDFYVMVKIPRTKVRDVSVSGRDIFLFEGDLNLLDFNHEFGETGE